MACKRSGVRLPLAPPKSLMISFSAFSSVARFPQRHRIHVSGGCGHLNKTQPQTNGTPDRFGTMKIADRPAGFIALTAKPDFIVKKIDCHLR